MTRAVRVGVFVKWPLSAKGGGAGEQAPSPQAHGQTSVNACPILQAWALLLCSLC